MPRSNKPKPTEPHPFGNTTRSFSLLLCLGALAGVLIWAKLRLVTDIPRSAYANPREAFPSEQEPDENTAQEQVQQPADEKSFEEDDADLQHPQPVDTLHSRP